MELQEVKEALSNFTDTVERRLEVVTLENAALKGRIENLEAIRAASGTIGDRQSPDVKAFERFVRTGDRAGLAAGEAKELSISGGASTGGAMVPEQIARDIISRAIARSRLASLPRQTGPVTSDYVRVLNLRGATASWSSEAGTRSSTSTPLMREVRPTSGELYAYPSFTRWLAEDSQFNVMDFISENVSDVFAKSLESSVLTGSGTNQPTGILDSSTVPTADDASPERDPDTIEFISGTADLADDVISLYFSCKPEYRANGVFVMSSATLAAVRKLRDSNGSGYLWQQNLGSSMDAPDGLLVGRPVVISEYLGPVGQSPALDSLLFGDFKAGYELVRIGGMVMIRDDVTTPGKIKLYIAQRFGGRLTDNDAIKSLQA